MAASDIVTSAAASPNAIQEVGSRLTEKIFSGILIFGVVIIVIGVLGFLIWWFLVYKKKFDITIKVKSERAEDKITEFFDKGAILKDKKSGGKYLRLWDLKIELPTPKFNIFQIVGGKDYLEILRTAENKFYYLTPPTINKKYVLESDGKYHRIADQSTFMIDANDEFWRAKRKQQNKDMFSTESPLMKLLPFIPAILGGVITIFILYILMSHLPGILASLSDLAVKISTAQGTGAVVPATV